MIESDQHIIGLNSPTMKQTEATQDIKILDFVKIKMISLSLCAIYSFLLIISSFAEASILKPETPSIPMTRVTVGKVMVPHRASQLTALNFQANTKSCPSAAPIQWRPYLDAASKAHLSPIVAIGTLRDLRLLPIQLVGSSGVKTLLGYHPQDINNAGLIIELTFNIKRRLKQQRHVEHFESGQDIKIQYRVSAALSTSLMPSINSLVNSYTDRHSARKRDSQNPETRLLGQNHRLLSLNQQVPASCAFELQEFEVAKKANKMLRLNQTYVLFLDVLDARQTQVEFYRDQQHQVYTSALYPFATHEQLTNQTSRALKRILCESCGVGQAQAAQVQLLNATFVNIAPDQPQASGAKSLDSANPMAQPESSHSNSNSTTGAVANNKVKLDCRVTGFPSVWVQWYRNGKLLRNKPGKWSVKTSKWNQRRDVQLSRLELELKAGRNETGIYECRAMNVVAREPAVGTYTLLVMPDHYAVIPMQPPAQPSDLVDKPSAGFTQTSQSLAGVARQTQAPKVSGTKSKISPNINQQQQQQQQQQREPSQQQSIKTMAEAKEANSAATESPVLASNSIQESPGASTGATVVGQPCPREAHDNFCLNKGTCVLIGHIEEYYCNCAEGYHGHRSPATFEQKFVVIQAKLGDNIRLECNATGDQPLTVDWFRGDGHTNGSSGGQNAIDKHGNDRYDVHETITDFGLSSQMQIRAVTQEDNFIYKCLASNEFGHNERLIKLIVLNVPERPSQVRVRDIWSRSALITWLSQYSSSSSLGQGPSSRVTNYTVQYWRKNSPLASGAQNHRREEVTVDGLQSSALLTNLMPALTYEVSVTSFNQVGHSEASETVNVTTSEEEPQAPPTDVMVEPRGSSTLRVSWKLPPIESLNGKLLGFYIGYRPRVSSPAAAALTNSGQQVQYFGHLMASQSPLVGQPQQPQQQQLHLSPVYSFKTTDAIEGQVHYDTFLTNLRSNSEYEVTVRAFNKAGSGPDCHTIVARTGHLAKLPLAPNLQVQKVTANSVTLKWTQNHLSSASIGHRVSGSSSQQNAAINQQQATQLQQPNPLEFIYRFVLYYQIQGERDWYELNVANSIQRPAPAYQQGAELSQEDQLRLFGLGVQSATDVMLANDLSSTSVISSQVPSNVHTLSNLQAGVAYRIYVAAANDYGIGDPSNVVSIRTDTNNSSSSSAFLGLAHLSSTSDSNSSFGSSIIESLGQQANGLLYTLLSSLSLLAILILVLAYLVWQRRLAAKYNSSSASSYPTSWTPAASNTIQSEYSVKRFPSVNQPTQNLVGQHQVEIYDEVGGCSQMAGGRSLSTARKAGSSSISSARIGPKQVATRLASATSSRPVLSSHYHQPADLMSSSQQPSNTLQLNSAFGQQSHRMSLGRVGQSSKCAMSATLNRGQAQNRQLPPIPYSTLSVKEMNSSKQQHQMNCGQWRMSTNQSEPRQQLAKGSQLRRQQADSQQPLIYGVIE